MRLVQNLFEQTLKQINIILHTGLLVINKKQFSFNSVTNLPWHLCNLQKYQPKNKNRMF